MQDFTQNDTQYKSLIFIIYDFIDSRFTVNAIEQIQTQREKP